MSVQAQVVLLFDRLRREHGCAVLLVTHDLGVAASIADRIVVLYAGRVCEIGPAATVLDAPSHPYTQALLAARLSVDGTATTTDPMPGEPPNPTALAAGLRVRAALRCGPSRTATPTLPELSRRATTAAPGTVACFHPIGGAPSRCVAVATGDPRSRDAPGHVEPAGGDGHRARARRTSASRSR